MRVEVSLKEKAAPVVYGVGWEAQPSFQVSGVAVACFFRCLTSARASVEWFGQRERSCFDRAGVNT